MGDQEEKLRAFFRNNIGYFIIAISCALYLLSSLINIQQTEQSTIVIVGDSVITFIMGYGINRVSGFQGILMGDRSDKMKATSEAYGQMIDTVSPYICKLDNWCVDENKKNYVYQRTMLLASVGIKYEEVFDDEGLPKDWKPNEERLANKYTRKREKKRIAMVEKCIKLKLTPVTAGLLMSENGKVNDKYDLGRTKTQFESQQGAKELLGKILIAIASGYFCVSLIENFDFSNLIWKGLQVGLFLLMGATKLYKSYVYMIDEYRNRIIKKIDILQKFDNYCKEQKDGNQELL